jgi:hypothetical protein
MCHLHIMFIIMIKKIIKLKNKQDLDARFWIQKALLDKNFNNNSI